VVGGWARRGVVRKCETFDVIKAKWTDLPDFDEFGEAVTLVSIKARFAMAVGGRNENDNFTNRIARIDSQKLHRGWEILSIVGQSPLSG